MKLQLDVLVLQAAQPLIAGSNTVEGLDYRGFELRLNGSDRDPILLLLVVIIVSLVCRKVFAWRLGPYHCRRIRRRQLGRSPGLARNWNVRSRLSALFDLGVWAGNGCIDVNN